MNLIKPFQFCTYDGHLLNFRLGSNVKYHAVITDPRTIADLSLVLDHKIGKVARYYKFNKYHEVRVFIEYKSRKYDVIKGTDHFRGYVTTGVINECGVNRNSIVLHNGDFPGDNMNQIDDLLEAIKHIDDGCGVSFGFEYNRIDSLKYE